MVLYLLISWKVVWNRFAGSWEGRFIAIHLVLRNSSLVPQKHTSLLEQDFFSFIDLLGYPHQSIQTPTITSRRAYSRGFSVNLNFGLVSQEPHYPWKNRAEYSIGEVKRQARKLMQQTQTPIRLWCFCYAYSENIMSLCGTSNFDLKGRTPYEVVKNYTPDISEYTTLSWFQWCWCFAKDRRCKRLCCWIGPSLSIGQSLCWYVLIENGEYIACFSVIAVDPLEIKTYNMVKRTSDFT